MLAYADKNKCGISVILSENLVDDKNLNASKIIKDISHHIQGGGGGQAFFATAGGKDPGNCRRRYKRGQIYALSFHSIDSNHFSNAR